MGRQEALVIIQDHKLRNQHLGFIQCKFDKSCVFQEHHYRLALPSKMTRMKNKKKSKNKRLQSVVTPMKPKSMITDGFTSFSTQP